MALSEEAARVLGVHGIGAGTPPAKPELWEAFKARPETTQAPQTIENRFYAGYSHDDLDWARPVHALFVDFKGDGMQLGHLLQHLTDCGEQYVFVGAPPPFNGGWHFTAVNDFEHPAEQRRLDPGWTDRRVWHRVNYVPALTPDGRPAIVPRARFDAARAADGALPVGPDRRFATVVLAGGLMPHTLNATLLDGAGGAGARLLAAHLELGADFAVVGHGLDALLALGPRERSLAHGFAAAVFPGQDHLLRVNGLRAGEGAEVLATGDDRRPIVCRHRYKSGSEAVLLSASLWGPGTKDVFLRSLGFAPGGAAPGPERLHVVATTEPVLRLDAARLPGLCGAACPARAAGAPSAAVLVDDVADPIEAFGIIEHLRDAGFGFRCISGSTRPGAAPGDVRTVTTETVYGNAMYGLKDCVVTIPTTPADRVPPDAAFDIVFIAGGQCPYFLMNDAAVMRIIDACPFAAAVCHGPEALIGSKWLHGPAGASGPFVSYYGAWMSFRDVLDRYERKKPGEICRDASGRLFTGNAPNATKPMLVAACEAVQAAKAGAV